MYVSEQQKAKWKHHLDSLKPGVLVLIKEYNQLPMKWKLGRVEFIYRGRDGVARVAELKTDGVSLTN